MFVISSMITLRAAPAYSQATPVAPAGSCVPPPPAAEVGFETVIPKALPTVAAEGQLAAAAVTVVVAVATGGVVGAEVGAVVAVAVGTALAALAVLAAVDVALLEPQAPAMTLTTRAAAASQRGLLCDTWDGSF
jgi:hypothetical protein